jgi:hypothetical protein
VSEYVLASEIYTPEAVAAGIKAFANHCNATAQPREGHTILSIEGTDDVHHAELLNYILTLSAQALLQ